MKTTLSVLLAVTVSFAALPSANAVQLNAESYYFVEASTGKVVLEKNADKQIAPASLTKMMTVYMLFNALKNDEIQLDTEFSISEKAWRKGGSKMFLEVGKKVKVEDLIKGILVVSGNDACIVAAEFLGGTEDAFAHMMNEKALELKMLNTHFTNSSGWPDPKQLSTAKDMTILARAIYEKFPEYYKYFSIERFTYSNIAQPNRNGLLGRGVGVDGMKTGHVENAGYHLVASAERDGVRLVSSVLGASSMKMREDETLTGLSYVFRTHNMVKIIAKDALMPSKAPVWMGEANFVSLRAGADLNLYLSRSEERKIKTEAVYNSPVVAPVEAGNVVGKLLVTNLETEEVYELPLLAGETVAEVGVFKKFWRYVKNSVGL